MKPQIEQQVDSTHQDSPQTLRQDPDESPPQASRRWSDVRDFFAALREAMIVSAVIFLILAPSYVRNALQRAGITSFAGVEFGVQEVLDAGQQVAVAEKQVETLVQQLTEIESQLQSLSNSGRAATPSEIQVIAGTLKTLKTQADSVDSALSQSTQKIDRAVSLMPPDQLRKLIERNKRNAGQTPVPTSPGFNRQSTIGLPPIELIQETNRPRIGRAPNGSGQAIVPDRLNPERIAPRLTPPNMLSR